MQPEVQMDERQAEQSWVMKYVERGGDPANGLSIYRRMRRTDANTLPAPPTLAPTAPANEAQSGQGAVEFDLLGDPAIVPAKKKRGRPQKQSVATDQTQSELDLLQLGHDIIKTPADNTTRGYVATAMIYASLPHSKIEGAVFKRRSNNVTLTILNDPDIGLPYGKIPRVITAFLCTEAKRTTERLIFLGKSKNEFAMKLGYGYAGRLSGDEYNRFEDHAKRLFTSSISLTGNGLNFKWDKLNLTDNGEIMWNEDEDEDESKGEHKLWYPHESKKTKWESYLNLSERFFNECINHSLPIDLRVMHKLVSPLAIDIYVWLCYRYNSIDKPTTITWKQLLPQFGANYNESEKGLFNFADKFRKYLRQVLKIYPEAKFTTDSQGLTLYPSPQHILPAS